MALESVVSNERLVESGLDERPGISWGAIFAGAFIALGFQILFMLLGSAIGLTAFDPERGDSLGAGAGIGAAIYLLLTMVISFFIGGYASSRLAGVKMRTPAILHGLSAWAVVAVFMVYLTGSGIGSILRGATGVLGQAGTAATQQASQQSAEVSPEVKERVLKGQGSKDDSAEVLSKTLGISKSGALDILNRGEQKAGQVNPNEIAGKATDVAAKGSWALFFSLLFSAVGASLGALSGSAGHIKRYRVANNRKAA